VLEVSREAKPAVLCLLQRLDRRSWVSVGKPTFRPSTGSPYCYPDMHISGRITWIRPFSVPDGLFALLGCMPKPSFSDQT
jgi:hypothetical protein